MSKGGSNNNNNTAAVLNRSPTGTTGTGSNDKNKGKSGTKITSNSNNMTTPPPPSSTTVTTPSSSYTPFTVVFQTKSTTQASKQAVSDVHPFTAVTAEASRHREARACGPPFGFAHVVLWEMSTRFADLAL